MFSGSKFFFKVLQLHQFDLECSPKPCRRTSTLEDQCFSASLKMRDPEILCFPTQLRHCLIGFGGGFPHVEMWLFFFQRSLVFTPGVYEGKPYQGLPETSGWNVRKHQLPVGKKTRNTIQAPSQWYLRWWNFTSSSLLAIVIYDLELPPTQDAIVTTRIMTF